MSNSRRKAGGFIVGIIVLVLGASMLAEGVVAQVTGTAFMFFENVHRGFELFVGLISVLLAAEIMSLSNA